MIAVAFAGLGLAVAWALAHQRPWSLIPAAHDAVFKDLRDGLFILDADGRIVEVNETAERIVGRPASEITGRPADDVFDERLRSCLASMADGEPTREVELGDGLDARVYEVRTLTVADDTHESGCIVVLRDITTYRHAETLLHATFLADASAILASSLDYEATLQQVAWLAIPALGDWCTVYTIGEDKEVRRVAVAYTDGEKAELARALRRYPPSPVSDRSSVAEAMRTRQPVLTPLIPHAYVDAIAQDAEHLEIMRRLDFRSSMTVPLEARGDVLGALAFFSSDPARRYDTRDLALAQDLARRAGLALDNARLYGQARRAIRARDEFLSVASHELKTPLTSMLGYAQMLLAHLKPNHQTDSEIVRRSLQAIEQQTGRLSRLVSRLLDIARIEGGQLAIEPTQTDLVPLVQGVVATMQAATAQHRLVARTPDSLTAPVDPLRLEQVVTNLVDNAIKFSPRGSEIDLELRQTSLGMARLTVTDHGPGIPLEGRQRIFERFYQASTGNLASGMGLGLYICRQIVEQHGGSIAAEFPAEGGTQFVVTLPLDTEGRDLSAPHSPGSARPTGA